MSEPLQLPTIDLSSTDYLSTAKSIRQACLDHGFFYLVNHGVEEESCKEVLELSKKFFLLPLEEKMKLAVKKHRCYAGSYDEKIDSSSAKADSKESFFIGPPAENHLNQWPFEDLPSRRSTMEAYYKKVLIMETLQVLHGAIFAASGEVDSTEEEVYGVSAHSDFGMITLLLTDGVPGLQGEIQATKDVPSISGAFIVNIGDMMERWTNCFFRSTMHRVVATGEECYPVALFINPSKECIVECLESCCSESCPPRYPPIRSLDYLEERYRAIYLVSPESQELYPQMECST